MAKLYRLLRKAQIDGAVRDVGFVFSLPEGVRGPHASRNPGFQHLGGYDNHFDRLGNVAPVPPALEDEPLYEEVEQPKVEVKVEPKPLPKVEPPKVEPKPVPKIVEQPKPKLVEDDGA